MDKNHSTGHIHILEDAVNTLARAITTNIRDTENELLELRKRVEQLEKIIAELLLENRKKN